LLVGMKRLDDREKSNGARGEQRKLATNILGAVVKFEE
jgi:hypothetical protein